MAWFPPACGGNQVNFCKNPYGDNYGNPAAQSTGRGAQRDRYAVVGAGRQFPVLKCHACGEYPPLKSNQGIAEERERLGAYLRVPAEPCCPDLDCANSGIGVSTGSPHYGRYGATRSGAKRYRCNACTKTFWVGYSTVQQEQPHKNRLIFQILMNKITGSPHYGRYGATRSGAKRYRCNACIKTFWVGYSTVQQEQPHKNRLIFQILMNKIPFRRRCEVADIAHGTLYPKLDFLHRQCLAFVGHRERRLLHSFSIPRLYLRVDRQDYVVNWTQREAKRNVQLTAVGSADNATR